MPLGFSNLKITGSTRTSTRLLSLVRKLDLGRHVGLDPDELKRRADVGAANEHLGVHLRGLRQAMHEDLIDDSSELEGSLASRP